MLRIATPHSLEDLIDFEGEASRLVRPGQHFDHAAYLAWALWNGAFDRYDLAHAIRTVPSLANLDLEPVKWAWNTTVWIGKSGDPYFVVRREYPDEPPLEVYIVNNPPGDRYGVPERTLYNFADADNDRVAVEAARMRAGQKAVIAYARQFGLMTSAEFRQMVDVDFRMDLETLVSRYAYEPVSQFGMQPRVRWGPDLTPGEDPGEAAINAWNPGPGGTPLEPTFVYFDMNMAEGNISRSRWTNVLNMILDSTAAGAGPNDHLPTSCPDLPGQTFQECARKLVYLRLPRLYAYWQHNRRFPSWPAEQRPLF